MFFRPAVQLYNTKYCENWNLLKLNISLNWAVYAHRCWQTIIGAPMNLWENHKEVLSEMWELQMWKYVPSYKIRVKPDLDAAQLWLSELEKVLCQY